MAIKSPASTGAKISSSGKVGIGFLVFLLLGVLYFVVFFSSVESDYQSAKQKEKTLTEEFEKSVKSKENFQKDKNEKLAKEKLAEEQKKVLPDSAELPSFLSNIQSLATGSGVKLTSWVPGEESNALFYIKVPMELSVTGNFHQIIKFLHGIGQMDRIANIENIEVKLSKDPVKSENVLVDVKCTATAFRSVRSNEVSDPNKKKGSKK